MGVGGPTFMVTPYVGCEFEECVPRGIFSSQGRSCRRRLCPSWPAPAPCPRAPPPAPPPPRPRRRPWPRSSATAAAAASTRRVSSPRGRRPRRLRLPRSPLSSARSGSRRRRRRRGRIAPRPPWSRAPSPRLLLSPPRQLIRASNPRCRRSCLEPGRAAEEEQEQERRLERGAAAPSPEPPTTPTP